MTPMTIPAIAPPESPDFLLVPAAREVDVADAEAAVPVGEVEDALDVAELTMLDEIEPPRTCANLITPTLLVQHALLSPQHHRSLSARPVHGVNGAFPKAPRTWSHTLRQSLLVTSLLAQKSTQYLAYVISNCHTKIN